MSRTLRGLVLACAVGLLASGASADDLKDKKVKGESLDDATFVEKVASGNMLEVKLGEIATKKGTHTEVKEFGQKMVKDHTKSLANLKKAAKASRMKVPDKLIAEHQRTLERFEKFDGKDFDAAYVRLMIKDHEEDVAYFEKASKELRPEDLRKYAVETLPVLRKHLEMVRKLGKMLDVKVSKER